MPMRLRFEAQDRSILLNGLEKQVSTELLDWQKLCQGEVPALQGGFNELEGYVDMLRVMGYYGILIKSNKHAQPSPILNMTIKYYKNTILYNVCVMRWFESYGSVLALYSATASSATSKRLRFRPRLRSGPHLRLAACAHAAGCLQAAHTAWR